jgi:hypothetical protein
MLAPGQAVIGRLSTRARRGDALALRARVGAALGWTGLDAPGLPPSAVLCVRRWRDPLPGALTAPGARAVAAWGEAARAALAELVRRAARPARESVPPSAEAVLFADRAELLACLIADHCDGVAALRWWWQGLFHDGWLARAPVAALLDAPEDVPAVLAHLAAQGRVLSFIRSLSAGEAAILLDAVARRFDLPAAVCLPLAPTAAASVATRPRRLSSDPPPPSPTAPWYRTAPEAVTLELGAEQSRLLGIALSLHRAPALARSSAFVESVRAWTQSPPENAPVSPQPAPAPAASPLTAPLADIEEPEPRQRALASAVAVATPPAQVEKPPDAPPRPGADHATELGPAHAAPPPMTDTTAAPIPLPVHETASSPDAAPAAPTPDAVPAESPLVFLTPTWIETDFGGLFYLVNLGLFIGLYGDFTTPRQPGIALPLWDFVALLGRELVGATLEGDPAWPLLAELAGRPSDQPPGKDFDPPDSLKPFPETAPMPPEDLSPRECWLFRLYAQARARLALALGLDDPAELPRVLCKHHARVFVTATRVDVVLSLDELPIAVRIAGLDRDPGWVPAAARTVAFHFE